MNQMNEGVILTIIKKKITNHCEPKIVELICIDGNIEVGKLRFDEPCSFCDEINIQEISIVQTRRREGIGAALLRELKELCISDYNSCSMTVFIAPTDNVEIDDLIKFYQANDFTVDKLKDANDEAWGQFHP